ncbi:MAG: hypothetical protein ACT4NY_29720 [Pseudonocardiales bacterium]
MDIIDVEKAVEERCVWLQDHLETAAGKLGVKQAGRVVNTYDMRSPGARALDDAPEEEEEEDEEE